MKTPKMRMVGAKFATQDADIRPQAVAPTLAHKRLQMGRKVPHSG
jgi:hypothetical protein